MNDINIVLNIIKEELQNTKPSSSKILKSLMDLRSKQEFQQLSDSEFYNIVGETINSKPEFFMEKLYNSFRSKMRKLIGDEKLMEMEQDILEKHFLHEGEQILLELRGNFGQNRKMTQPIFIDRANLFVTNDRIIVQGKVKGPYNKYSSERGFYGYLVPIKSNYRLRRVRNNIRYRVIVNDRESEINIKVTLGESEAKREENINKLFEIISKETSEEPSS
ncbi:MAG: hypothetical protein ACFFBI_00910 [Promethearchaeota archaeon]